MSYLVGSTLADQPAGIRFRELLQRPDILRMPGTHNGMAALIRCGRRRGIAPESLARPCIAGIAPTHPG